MKNPTLKTCFFQYVLPTIFAFMLSGIYTIVDGFFVGNRMGDAGLASITIAYPIAALMTAIGSSLGLGGAICYTVATAQRDEKESRYTLGGTVLLIVAVSVIVSVGFLCCLNPLLTLLGAEGQTLIFAEEYGRIIVLCAVFQMLGTGLVPFIRNMGGASFATVSMVCGFLTNVVLDYLFVWVWGLGMAGAAWATIIGQVITMLLAAGYFVYKKTKNRTPECKRTVRTLGKSIADRCCTLRAYFFSVCNADFHE